MTKLSAHSETWHHDVLVGLQWYVLDSEIEKEPGACETIAIALNKKNAAAMATGHLEIMRTLVGLCIPSPQGETVPFGPVKQVLLEMFGSSADHPNLVDCFNIVRSVGGRDSLLVKEFFDFCDQFVIEYGYKFRMEIYDAIASIPVCFPRVKFMLLKTCWCTPGKMRDWCVVPPNMQQRFVVSRSKFTWKDLMEELETVCMFASTLVSAVVDRDITLNKFDWKCIVECDWQRRNGFRNWKSTWVVYC